MSFSFFQISAAVPTKEHPMIGICRSINLPTRLVIAMGFITVFASLGLTAGDEKKTVGKDAYAGDSLCKEQDQVVFSCPLAHSKKIVSICAARGAAPHHLYYAFGKPGSIEMSFPENAVGAAQNFKRSFLNYAGGTGGYVFSFSVKNFKYMVYKISGAHSDSGGIAVQKEGSVLATMDSKCERGKIAEVSDHNLLQDTLKLKPDEEIRRYGLPPVK
jgi:hypothetical protein